MTTTPPVYVVSGGMGKSGEQMARTALAQFHEIETRIIVVPQIRDVEQLKKVVAKAKKASGIIIHTLVDANLRSELFDLAQKANVPAVDLMGPLLLSLTRLLERKPLGQPGLYRELREDYFQRIEAIEFAVDHDDGRKTEELALAQIVLVGVSRSGKTPLCMYLSTRGWKAANVPLIKGLNPPPELFKIDPQRVVGLTIHPEQLMAFRRRRQQRLHVTGMMDYTDEQAIDAELKFARQIYKQGGFAVIDITDKPIEESADEVVLHVTGQARDEEA